MAQDVIRRQDSHTCLMTLKANSALPMFLALSKRGGLVNIDDLFKNTGRGDTEVAAHSEQGDEV